MAATAIYCPEMLQAPVHVSDPPLALPGPSGAECGSGPGAQAGREGGVGPGTPGVGELVLGGRPCLT